MFWLVDKKKTFLIQKNAPKDASKFSFQLCFSVIGRFSPVYKLWQAFGTIFRITDSCRNSEQQIQLQASIWKPEQASGLLDLKGLGHEKNSIIKALKSLFLFLLEAASGPESSFESRLWLVNFRWFFLHPLRGGSSLRDGRTPKKIDQWQRRKAEIELWCGFQCNL